MSAYKYVSAEGALRYLKTFSLRITPPDQFNDPFEMRPPIRISALSVAPDANKYWEEEMRSILRKAILSQGVLTQAVDAEVLIAGISDYILRKLTPLEEEALQETLFGLNPLADFSGLKAWRVQIDGLRNEAVRSVHEKLPALLHMAEAAFHKKLPEFMGVLCLSGSGKHPLMWAHYADCHRGAMLEFNERAPCFNRRRTSGDEFGCIRRVRYSDTRPAITEDSDQDGVAELALTKALEWSYEQEMRLLWPLDLSDRKIEIRDGKIIHLIEVPPSALKMRHLRMQG